MLRRLCCLTLCITLFTFFSSLPASAQQKNHESSYFSFFQNYLLAYNAIDIYNKHVLAAETKRSTPLPTLSPVAQTNLPLSEVSSYLLNRVNEYRISLGLPTVQSSPQTCSFAAVRAKEIATSGFTHDGFYNRVHNHTIPYTNWSHAVENIAQAPDYKEVVTLWKNSPGHAANMRDTTPYVCIMQYDSYYAYEGMRL